MSVAIRGMHDMMRMSDGGMVRGMSDGSMVRGMSHGGVVRGMSHGGMVRDMGHGGMVRMSWDVVVHVWMVIGHSIGSWLLKKAP